jgi:tetratricopeptide (TPR) repeat protein
MPRAWQVGDRIQGRWEIYQVLCGGAGAVYIVYDMQLRLPFAAKTFLDEVYEQDPTIAQRFLQEAFAWTSLDVHPNVVQARMTEMIDGRPFIFLEYVSGGDLSHWIGTPRLTEDLKQVLRFAIQFCDGMIHASSRGLHVHRDIKPRNCLVTQDRTLKVTDFGLAKLVGFQRSDAVRSSNAFQPFSLTMSGVGTCTHMAPEQFHDARNVDTRADVYSFGVMLYQMITGELPFIGESWEELESKHKSAPPPILKHPNRGLRDLIQVCLAKSPEQRLANFEQVRQPLSAIYQVEFGEPAPSPVKGAQLTALDWNNKGSSLDQLGKHEEALACFDQASRLNPSIPEPWFNKGVALHALKRIPEALECYERALTLNPKSEQAWSNKGVALKAMGRGRDALVCYERAIEINPRYPEAWANKGVALRADKQTDGSISCYDRALQLNPRDAKVWTNKGNALYSLNRMQDALKCYDKALTINPNLEHAWLQKGLAEMSLGKSREAIDSFERAVELAPNLGAAWYYKAATLVNGFQRYGDALPYFEEAHRLGQKEAADGVALCRKALALV